MGNLEAARRALRERQGLGARYDAPEAPAAELRLARAGTAYFARKLNELGDFELYQPCLLHGWTRAHLICNVAYQARAISRQGEAVAVGDEPPPMYDSEKDRLANIELGATLPARALRHLFTHAAVHLNVVWRDMPGAGWDSMTTDDEGLPRTFSATAMERAYTLWRGALYLGNGARIRDLPMELQK